MFFRTLFTNHLYELLLIVISAYVLCKSGKTRDANVATRAFSGFAVANLIFQLSNLGMNLYREEEIQAGLGFGYLVYILAIVTMAAGAYYWLIYVEEITGSGRFDTLKKKLLLAVPLFVLFLLCIVSVRTGWLFYFDADGKYDIGPLFFLQYVFIYGYVLMAMIRSGVNYFKADKKSETDRVLLIIMLVDTFAAVIQLIYPVFAIDTAFLLTLIFCYINLYTEELRKDEKLYFEKMQVAMDAADLERQRVRMLTGILESSNWIYEIDADDNVVSVDYGDLINSKVDAASVENPMLWVELVHPDDRERVLAGFMAPITDHSGKSAYDEVFRILDRDGNYRWSRSIGEVSRREDGSGEYVGMSMDMTRQIAEQENRLLGAVPISPDVLSKANIGLWAFELDEGQPPRMYDDKTMLGLVGLDRQVPPEEAYHAWYDNIDGGSYDLVADAVAKMSSGQHAEVQYPWHYPDGRTIIVRCGGVRNFEYTKGIRIEGTHQDVTQTLHYDEEQRKREEQQRQDEIARIKAESSDKAKTEFLFNMSHDIRTPMNAILGYTDIALRHSDDREKVNESLQKIRLSGGHLLSLINDILEMSRIESGKLEITEEPLNIYEAIEGVEYMSRTLASAKDIDFEVKLGDIANPYIYADELHINQVLINLISNAIKYTNPGGKVEYRVEQISGPVDGVARFSVKVKDNGIGMSEEFQKHLFESFAREKTSTVSRQEGAGLGLAIVKRILDIIGGTISVTSVKDAGSEFTVELPFRVMDEDAIRRFTEEKESSQAIDDDVSFEGRKVLLVEDNVMNREIAAELLEEAGLIVLEAADGDVAVEKVRDTGPDFYDFILMDIQMPVMNGYEATKAIRALPGGDRVPIIALSANAFEEDRLASKEAGMNDHVAKPINVKELFAVLAKYL